VRGDENRRGRDGIDTASHQEIESMVGSDEEAVLVTKTSAKVDRRGTKG
jgi:hypothetical protein